MTRRLFALWLVMLLALLHGLAYAIVVPIWQTPDEPLLYEYAALVAEMGRVPRYEDRSAQIEGRVAASLNEEHFWTYLLNRTPPELPSTLDEALRLYPMPRQVGGDPPLYFLLAALPLRFAIDWSVGRQVLLLRIVDALMLPAIVAFAYAAAREVAAWKVSEAHLFGLAVAGLVAFQPMLAAIGASLTNDSLANLLGAGLFWMLVRILRRGLSVRRVLIAIALLSLGLVTKRTMLVYCLMSGATLWIAARSTRPFIFFARQRRLRSIMLVIVVGLVLVSAGAQLSWSKASSWWDIEERDLVARVWPAEGSGAALRVSMGQLILQPLPLASLARLGGQAVAYRARVWGGQDGSGRLIIWTGSRSQEFPFQVDSQQAISMTATVPVDAPDLWVGITGDQGWFYVDDVEASVAHLPGAVVLNGDFETPALRPSSPLGRAVSSLRLVDTAWALRSGLPLTEFSYRTWAGILFASFWGHFGWMTVSFVYGSPWQLVLALVCLVGICSTVWRLVRRLPDARQRCQLWLSLLMPAVAVLVLLVTAYGEASGLQQGRYLFPLAVPIAIVITYGHFVLLPARWRPTWTIGWLGFWMVLAATALIRVGSYYG